MPNGNALFETARAIMEGKIPIPNQVSNSLLGAMLVDIRNFQVEDHNAIEALGRRIADLEGEGRSQKVLVERYMTWPWIKDEVLMPVIKYILVFVIGWVLLKATGQIP